MQTKKDKTRKVPYGYWTKERIAEYARKYTKRKEFEKAYPSAYRQACKLKIIKTVCHHMEYVRVRPY